MATALAGSGRRSGGGGREIVFVSFRGFVVSTAPVAMNLLHRHIFWSVLTACLAAVGFFAFVLILGNAMKDLIGYVLAGQIPLPVFGKLLGLLVPYVAAYALPMGVLTGVLLVLGRMSAQREVTAMRAAGLSVGFIARPILLLGLTGALLAAAVNFYYMPRARTAYKATLAEAVSRNPLSFIVPKTFIRDFPGVVIYVNDKDGGELRDLWVWQLDDQQRVLTFGRAQTGRVEYDQETNVIQVTLSQVAVEYRDPAHPEDFSKAPHTAAVESWPIRLELDSILGRQPQRQRVAWMTWDQLLAERARAARSEDAEAALKVSIAINQKASSAVAVLAFAFLAVPLGIKVSRRETSANLGVALVLVMGYYFLTIIAGWLEKYPALQPQLWLWVPVLVFLGLGGWWFQRIGRA